MVSLFVVSKLWWFWGGVWTELTQMLTPSSTAFIVYTTHVHSTTHPTLKQRYHLHMHTHTHTHSHQTEKHYPNGTKEITFPDKTVKFIYPSGEEESVFCDGNTQRLYPNGDLVIQFANGQREFHTKDYKVSSCDYSYYSCA